MNRFTIALFSFMAAAGNVAAQGGRDATMPQAAPARVEMPATFPDREMRNTIQTPQTGNTGGNVSAAPERAYQIASGPVGDMNGTVRHTPRPHAAADGTIYVQDRGLREARYNSVFSPATRNAYINPGYGTVETRYNTTFRRYFYYCSSPFSRKCSDAPARNYGGNVAETMYPDRVLAGMCTACTDIMGRRTYRPCSYHAHRDAQLLPDNTTRYSNSAQYFSFDGRVMHGRDTIEGIVTIVANGVSVEHGTITNRRTSSWALSDTSLKAIVVYKGIRQLQLVRLNANDKHLSRVVHSGLLNVYDRSYSFVTPQNVRKKLLVQYAVTGEVAEINDTQALAAAMNKTYGLLLNGVEETRAGLVTYLHRLD
jgi:hypothetical protein